MEWWNGGIVEWTTLYHMYTNLFERTHYAVQLEQSQKGDREEEVRDVDTETQRGKSTEHNADNLAIDLDLLLFPAQIEYLPQ